MKITLIGGVVKSVNKFIAKSKSYFTKERLIAISMLSRIVGMVLLMSVIPLGAMKVEAQKDSNPVVSTIDPKVSLDVQRSVPIKLEIVQPEIKVGESEYLKKEREAREAEEARQTQLALGSRETVAREEYRPAPYDPDLASKRDLAKRAAAAYGIDWKLVEAVWQVESGKSWDTTTASYAGAQGPMQFMPGTWAAYAVDADGDGVANINDAEDAVYTGAKYLAAGGAGSGNVDGALFNYNHAQWYVDMVKGVAASITD